MCMPGIDVGIEPNGPPEGRPGLESQVSNWLGAPHNQRSMQRLPRLRAESANAGTLNKLRKLATDAAPAMLPCRNNRRCNRWSTLRSREKANRATQDGLRDERNLTNQLDGHDTELIDQRGSFGTVGQRQEVLQRYQSIESIPGIFQLEMEPSRLVSYSV